MSNATRSYCASRLSTLRRHTIEVKVGSLGVGGNQPLRLQSMTTSDTQDIVATVTQSIALAEVGCEIVRITAPNVAAAACLKEIRSRFSAAGFAHIPLVADIHFLPQAAMEAVEHVEKIRVNPGNYADKKKFAVRDYSDGDYQLELERLHEAFSPLVLRCKALGRSLRIGTNHGSLSDRIMNRYGDSPLGMVESALEFVRICEYHGFHDILLSMKASNPKVVVQAYRLLVARMDAAHKPYPLHLGVTEAGDGEDGRIKSAIGIGALLLDGIGDTLRVSLTEDSIHEIPVARGIANKIMALWHDPKPPSQEAFPADPYSYTRRRTRPCIISPTTSVGGTEPPRVAVPAGETTPEALVGIEKKDTPAELLLGAAPFRSGRTGVITLASGLNKDHWESQTATLPPGTVLLACLSESDGQVLADLLLLCRRHGLILALDAPASVLRALGPVLAALGPENLIATLSDRRRDCAAGHAVGAYRALASTLDSQACAAPIWIRSTTENLIEPERDPDSLLLEGSMLAGTLLADGIGDLLSIETESSPEAALSLAYGILQGAGARITRTEYVACPSCGRTLFDLQTTTQAIRAETSHLKGVKIAIMGCIVNGPGEMADADFGYVGGAPGRINLYVGKTCVQYNIPEAEARTRLIGLIREHGRWIDPPKANAQT